MNLLDYFQLHRGQWVSRDDVANFLNVTKRTAQDKVNELNQSLMESGAAVLVCSGTDNENEKSGYILTDHVPTIETYLAQISKHAVGELKKRKPAKVILRRIRENRLKKQSPPIVEESGQVRLF